MPKAILCPRPCFQDEVRADFPDIEGVSTGAAWRMNRTPVSRQPPPGPVLLPQSWGQRKKDIGPPISFLWRWHSSLRPLPGEGRQSPGRPVFSSISRDSLFPGNSWAGPILPLSFLPAGEFWPEKPPRWWRSGWGIGKPFERAARSREIRKRLSTTIRRGCLKTFPFAGRAVNRGLSLRTVPIPTSMASTVWRRKWTYFLDASLETQRASPERVAIFPSRVKAAFRITYGVPVVMNLQKGAFNSRQASLQNPHFHFDPCSSQAPDSPSGYQGDWDLSSPRRLFRLPPSIPLRCRAGFSRSDCRARGSRKAWRPAGLFPGRAAGPELRHGVRRRGGGIPARQSGFPGQPPPPPWDWGSSVPIPLRASRRAKRMYFSSSLIRITIIHAVSRYIFKRRKG